LFWLLLLQVVEDCLAQSTCRERDVAETRTLPTGADFAAVLAAAALLADALLETVTPDDGAGAPDTATKLSPALDMGDHIFTSDGSSLPSNVMLAWPVCLFTAKRDAKDDNVAAFNVGDADESPEAVVRARDVVANDTGVVGSDVMGSRDLKRRPWGNFLAGRLKCSGASGRSTERAALRLARVTGWTSVAPRCDCGASQIFFWA
jgi:hypothetical protein